MGDDTRRFTDREVALVLQRAAELDDIEPAEGGGGLTLEDLRDIAREVGISPTAVDRAVASLDAGGRVGPSLWGAPSARKAVRAVPSEIDRDGLARLMSMVDERVESTGSVTEALGAVRWTGRDRFKSTRVSVTPKGGETTIEVVEKAEPKMRRVFHLLPAAWGVMLAAPFAGALAAPGAVAVAGIGAAAGLAAGRAVWSAVSRSSERRVRRLAAELADEAATLRR